jgi:hypothetical protein
MHKSGICGVSVSGLLAVVGAACVAAPALAQTFNVNLRPIINTGGGLTRPIYLTAINGDNSRLFVVEQRGSQATASRGAVRIINNTPTPTLVGPAFLVINGLSTGSEQGFLGLAFHPRWREGPEFRYFWVNYTNTSGTTVIARGRVDPNNPNLADTSFGTAGLQTLFTIAQPFSNHNGGWIDFGPDGNLYIAMGDGGSGGDPQNNGQRFDTQLGKMLRIDVDGPDGIPGNADDGDPGNPTGRPFHRIPANNPFVGLGAGFAQAIWSFGLRNHWRNSFDRLTGDLWMADVGQNAWEEVNFEPAFDRVNTFPGQPGYTGGWNYGWAAREGLQQYDARPLAFPPPASGLRQTRVDPVLDYNHAGGVPPTNQGGCSVTGGFVYRGCAIPSLQGWYVFGDYCNGWVGAYNRSTGQFRTLFNVGFGLTSFGEDAEGEIYVVIGTSSANSVQRIAPNPGSFPDCNTNGVPDGCDIARRTSNDLNANGVPDECDSCEQDVNGDGVVDFNDLLEYLNLYNASNPRADINLDGVIDFNDLLDFLNLYNTPCI